MYYSYAIIYSLLFLHQYNMYNAGTIVHVGFSGGSVVKNPPANAGDTGSVPRLGRYPGEGNGNLLQYPCQEIPWTEEPGGLQSMGLQFLQQGFVSKEQQQVELNMSKDACMGNNFICRFIINYLILLF